MTRRLSLALGLALAVATVAAGCGAKTVRVAVPPRIDLLPFQTIGVVDFVADPASDLDQFATQRFMAVVQRHQPGVRFLELGPAAALLAEVRRDRLDAETLRLLGQRYRVDSVFTGAYEISNVKPAVSVTDLTTLSASARVKLALAVKHWDAKSGATIWTNSRWGEWKVAGFDKVAGVGISVKVSDPRDRYGAYLSQLVDAVTSDFQVRYEARPVSQ